MLVILLLVASACSSEETDGHTKEENKNSEVESNESEKNIEQKEEKKAEKETKSYINLEEFNSKYVKSTDEEQYPNGKFQLKDGSKVHADYYTYSENDLFYYASAIFHDGKLATVQFETEATEKEIEDALGVKFGENVLVEQTGIGFEITFNELFHESNIGVYPFEWE
jgi:hypothetical protein